MLVKYLIAELRKCPADARVFIDSGCTVPLDYVDILDNGIVTLCKIPASETHTDEELVIPLGGAVGGYMSGCPKCGNTTAECVVGNYWKCSRCDSSPASDGIECKIKSFVPLVYSAPQGIAQGHSAESFNNIYRSMGQDPKSLPRREWQREYIGEWKSPEMQTIDQTILFLENAPHWQRLVSRLDIDGNGTVELDPENGLEISFEYGFCGETLTYSDLNDKLLSDDMEELEAHLREDINRALAFDNRWGKK